MILKQATTSASALPARPERPFKHVFPVAAPDGSFGYDRPPENYFDSSMAPRLLPPVPPSRLYDTVALFYDHQYQITPDTPNPSWSTSRPLVLKPRERRRSVALVTGDSPDYMGILPDVPGWHPRRSHYEDRRGAVGVTPSEVNTLVPYIPPIDTSLPPPSKEWLDVMAKRFLADAHADFEDSRRNATNDATPPTESSEPSPELDDNFFDYDTDSTLNLNAVVPVSRTSMPRPAQQVAQANEYSSHDADFDSGTDTDTDTDTDSDDGYDWSVPRTPPSGPGAKWLIPRKRPSVVIVNNKDVATTNVDDSTDASRGPSYPGKRRRGGKTGYPMRVSKTPKRHINDTPARHTTDVEQVGHPSSRPPTRPSPLESDTPTSSRPPVSSVTATALQMRQVRITSPGVLPQPHTASSVPPKSPKLFPCMLDGCTQVCASAGDLQRHQLSLRHRAPSHNCLACGKSYTRPDALKRHLNSKVACKKEHTAKLATNGEEVGEGRAEANDDAVQIVVMPS